VVGVLLPVFVLVEVNRPFLAPFSELVLFATLGLVLAYTRPRPVTAKALLRGLDLALAVLALGVGGYLLVHSEPVFSDLWWQGRSLGDRAGAEGPVDLVVGALALGLILEAARRTLGWALPLLSVGFLVYGLVGASLPAWLLPHRGYGLSRLLTQTVLQSQGVFGVALQVMLTYVFLFLLFGAVLEATGATGFVLGAAERLFRGHRSGPAKVAVISSGLLGSLSGSAVANTATAGTFTIPMMKRVGFPGHVAGGLEAAASSGGALVPPVMGAGAYMMLEIIDPPVRFLQVVQAAILPSLLYYFSLYLTVHLEGQRLQAVSPRGEAGDGAETAGGERPSQLWPGLVFVGGLVLLLTFLIRGLSVPRSVTLALLGVVAVSSLSRQTRPSWKALLATLRSAAAGAVPLVAAAAAVGVVLGVVTLTGLGSQLPALLLPLAEKNLLLALLALMASSLILGMGLPSAVCYLLLATLVGPVLGDLGVVPLAAHLFIFYFGMLSMVTPPVALAAYAASSIAGSPLLPTAWAAFRYALAGFTLPFLFVFRPQLLFLTADGGAAPWASVLLAFALAALGVAPLTAALAGWLRGPLSWMERGLLLASALLALFPGKGPLFQSENVSVWNLLGITLFAGLFGYRVLRHRQQGGAVLRAGPGGGA
jgi:TRAP transporter 4TM/12TM fusion protein